MYYTVTYKPSTRQRHDKHIFAGANARNNRISIARQWISIQTSKTETLCFLRDPCRKVTKGQRRSFVGVEVNCKVELRDASLPEELN
jgi:hypothetical protein